MVFSFLFSAAGLHLALAGVPVAAPLRARNPPGVSTDLTLGHIARSLNSLRIAGRDQVFSSNKTVLDTTWTGATLLAQGIPTGGGDRGNTSPSGNVFVEITCDTCYIKGAASASLTIKGDPNAVFSNYTDEVKSTVQNVTDTVVDILVDYFGDVVDAAFEDLTTFSKPELSDYEFPTLDVEFDVNLVPLPEVSVRFEFDEGLELYMQLNTRLEAGATYTLNLFASKTPIGIGLSSDVSAGVTVAIDLILDVRAAIDISSGFHLKLDKGVGMSLSMFSRDVADIDFPGGQFEFLPVTLVSSNASLSGVLRVALKAGLELDASTIAGLERLDALPFIPSAGVVAEVFANVAEFTTTVQVPIRDDEDAPRKCDLEVIEAFQFALGAAAGATVGLGLLEWGPVQATSVPIFYTTMSPACAVRKTSATIPPPAAGTTSSTTTRSTATRATSTATKSAFTATMSTSSTRPTPTQSLEDRAGAQLIARDDLTTTTLTSTAIFTGLSCMSTGMVNCPASLQATSTFKSILSHVTAVPSGFRPAFPLTKVTAVSAVPFGTGAMALAASSGVPVSYVPPPPTPTGIAEADDRAGGGASEEGLSKGTTLGLALGLGLGGAAAAIGGLIFYMRRQQTWRAVPRSPSGEVFLKERDWAPRGY